MSVSTRDYEKKDLPVGILLN
jgi:hypothetical protein